MDIFKRITFLDVHKSGQITMGKRALYISFTTVTFVLCFIFFGKDDSVNLHGEQEDHALDWFENWYNQRAMPFDKIPNGAYLRAAQYVQSKMTNERSFKGAGITDTSQWQSIGPNNVGGRVLSIAVDPSNSNNVWAGAASGGLWKSTTAGIGASAWTYVNTGYPTVSISSIAINASNTNIMYIGTGEVGSIYGRAQIGTPGARSTYGMGILKSTNGGSTWSQTGLTFTFPQITAIQKVLLNPQNPNTVYAATTEGVYKSINAGSTWSVSNSVLMSMDIVINPSDTTVLYASHGQRNSTANPGLYKTTNAGTSWTLLSGGLPASNFGRTGLAISPTNPQVVYAGIANASSSQILGLYKTTDGGTSWTLKSGTNYVNGQGWYDNVVAVHPVNPETVYCAGLDIYKSVNGGSTLTQQTVWFLGYDHVVPAGGPEGPTNYAHADHHAIAFDPNNSNIIYHGCDGGIFASMDGGTTFSGRNGGFITTQFYNGFANAETDGSIALGGLQDNGTVKYLGNMSWDKTYGGDGGWCAIDPTNSNVLYEEYVYLAISKSTDGGTNWFNSSSGLPSGNSSLNNFIAPFVLSPSNPNILYGGSTAVYKTIDGGNSWTATNGGADLNGIPIACIGVSYKNSDTLLAGTGSGAIGATPLFQIFRSTNGGTSWANVTGSLPNRYPTDISFDPNSSLIAYLTYSGYGSSHVFKSTNAGSTWTNISANLPDIPTQSIVVDPLFPSHLYVGTDLGVYRSLDGGTSWQVFDNGMPPAMILDLAISSTNRMLRAATFGNGVYERELALPAIFDYRALALVSPTNASTLLLESTISLISASFNNSGSQTPTDSFDVKYRILNGVTEVYSNTKHISALDTAEVRQVTFDGSYTPPDTGTYTLQAISLAADQNATNDTTSGTLFVTTAPSIVYSIVTKESCTYSEITGGTFAANGDDHQMTVPLPFPIEFDGYPYDSAQVSTNGWMELGTGTQGSLRGISTPAQIGSIGANPNGRLFTTAHPTKALGIWWEDMYVDGSGSLTYKTLGSAPDRIFVVQWKNVLAYYDAATTTTRVNFQARLHETTNIIEFAYGPVTAGTLTNDSQVGAMTGIKDHIGGDYHFYDMALGGSGTVSQGITNLSPLTDWPGPDSCYEIVPQLINTSVSVSVNNRWNLASVPVIRTDYSVASIFPTAISGTTYLYDGAYQQRDSLTPGKGYWTKFPAVANQNIEGTTLANITTSVNSGWNLIGSVDHAIAAPSGGIITSSFFGYSSGYQIVDSLRPGKGYWVKTSSAGSLTFGPTALPRVASQRVDQFAQVTITDKPGNQQTLYVTGNSDGNINLNRYDMPPCSPAGMFDARFASQRILEAYPISMKENASYPILLTNAQYPLKVSFNLNNNKGKRFILEEWEAGKVVASHLLSDGKSVTIEKRTNNSLVLKVSDSAPVPASYALRQNYPNPFNPSTTISFDLPENVFVSLRVYDITGREVRNLVEGTFPAGSYSINADFSNLASSIYFYRLTAGTFSELKKMVLVK